MIVWSVQFFGELRLAFWFWKSKDAAAPRWTLLLLITHGPCESGTRHQRIKCLQTRTKGSLAKMPTRESVKFQEMCD